MLNENSDGTVLCRYGVRWARAGCCRNKSFMNNSAGMYNTNTSNGGFVMSEKIYLKICLIYHSMMTVRLRRNCMADMQRTL